MNKPRRPPTPSSMSPPHLCSVVSNRSTGRQHSAVLVLSSARDPNNIEFSSTGIHKHTAFIILPRTWHYVSHHNKIFVSTSEWDPGLPGQKKVDHCWTSTFFFFFFPTCTSGAVRGALPLHYFVNRCSSLRGALVLILRIKAADMSGRPLTS